MAAMSWLAGRDIEEARILADAYSQMFPPQMKEIERHLWPKEFDQMDLAAPQRVWRSRYYIAVLYQEPNKPEPRLSINRAAINSRGQFVDGITWDELMKVKRECGFGDIDAVELYPRDVDIVNVQNIRHLWLLTTPSALAWRDQPLEGSHDEG